MADKANRKLSEVLKKIIENSYSKAEADEYRTVKDLTHLTTQDEVYNALENGRSGYKVKINNTEYTIVSNVLKLAALAEFEIRALNVSGKLSSYKAIARPNVNTPIVLSGLMTIRVQTPTLDTEATTKKYVDDTIAAIPVPDIEAKFADGTTTADQASAGYGKTELEEATITIPASIVNVPYSVLNGKYSNADLIVIPAGEIITSVNFGTHDNKGEYTFKADGTNKWRIWDNAPGYGWVPNTNQQTLTLSNNKFSAASADTTTSYGNIEIKVNTTKQNTPAQTITKVTKVK